MSRNPEEFIWGINPTAFGLIVDKSEGQARRFILYKHELKGLCPLKINCNKQWKFSGSEIKPCETFNY